MTERSIAVNIHVDRHAHGAQRVRAGAEPPRALLPGRIPRLSRLMALAIRFDQLLRDGTVPNYAALARLGQVTRARITQIMNLRHLAPDLQEALLFLPRIEGGRAPLRLVDLQPLAALLDWSAQRQRWRVLLTERGLRGAVELPRSGPDLP